jgi:hypothetical protein
MVVQKPVTVIKRHHAAWNAPEAPGLVPTCILPRAPVGNIVTHNAA